MRADRVEYSLTSQPALVPTSGQSDEQVANIMAASRCAEAYINRVLTKQTVTASFTVERGGGE